MELNIVYISIIQFVVTSAFFFVEAVLHYNMGKYGEMKLSVPPLKKSLHLLSIIIVFSALSSGATFLIELYLLNK